MHIIIKWQSREDERVCPICAAINGYEWTFTVPNPLPTELVHPQFGVVWTLGLGSRAHGHQKYNCRCNVHITNVNIDDVYEWAEKNLVKIEASKI